MRTNCSDSNMAAALQLLKSIYRRRQEKYDLEMQMLVTQKSESPKLMQIQFGRLREQMQTP